MDLCCGNVSLLPSSAFVQNSFKGPACFPTCEWLVSWSCADGLSPCLVVYVVLGRWPLLIISLLCTSLTGVQCSSKLELVQNTQRVSPLPLKLPFYRRYTMYQTALFPCIHLLWSYLKFKLIFSKVCFVWCLPFIVHWILETRLEPLEEKLGSINYLISNIFSRTYP